VIISKRILQITKEFLHTQAAGGLILFASAIVAVFIYNSDLASYYNDFFTTKLPLNLSFLSIHKQMDVKMWIDDGLMAIFFLLVGLELKREIVIGELSSKSKITLPFLAAIGGVIMPILIYCFINFGDLNNLRGAAIPAATDIAFAIGVLSLFGNKISYSLKVFLVALAIIDDLIAILIIAFFYSSNINLHYLNYALLTTLLLWCFNRIKITSLIPYLLVAPFLWVFVLKSGVHPTIAGVILAFFIPFGVNKNIINSIDTPISIRNSPLKLLENFLHIPVAYFILPIFAFANSGIVISGISHDIFFDKIVLGIIFGLFFGKQIGIFSVVYLLEKLKICQFFKDASWLEFYGVAIIAGIGFTMSLFIGNLAFINPEIIDKVRIGVIFGSLLSGIFGIIVLKIAIK
jgi:NhaA family Na+:H+ antiporter